MERKGAAGSQSLREFQVVTSKQSGRSKNDCCLESGGVCMLALNANAFVFFATVL
jgi:hypothetical protein